MEETKIKKIKFISTKDMIHIEYVENGNDARVTFREPASPEFYKALGDLQDAVAEIFELPLSIKLRLMPYGVCYRYGKDGTMGAIINAKLTLSTGQTVEMATPMRQCAPEPEAKGNYLTEEAECRLWKLEAETRKYLAGRRQQVELFDTGTQVEEKPAETPAEIINTDDHREAM